MDSKTARWMQIKRLGYMELQALHRAEEAADDAYQAASKAQARPRDCWMEASIRFLGRKNLSAGLFWDKRKSEDEKKMEINRFEALVFPIWAPIFQKANSGEVTELEAYHLADKAIWADKGCAVNTKPLKNEKSTELDEAFA